MYYTSNQSSNDYYSSYKKNMQEQPERNSIKKIIKLGFIILFFAILSVAIVYLFNYFSTETTDPIFTSKETTHPIPLENQPLEESILKKIELTGNELPQSKQLQESASQSIAQIQLNATDTLKPKDEKSPIQKAMISNKVSQVTEAVNINPKDIALIVEIIMTQMNNSKEPTLEEQLIHAENQTMVQQDLKEVNHYNKVVINSNDKQENQSVLTQLRDDLNQIVNTSNQENTPSNYSKAITEEISIRSNEMKIIIVQKGDTLSKIAQKAYGKKDDYLKILIANPEILKNPDKIFVGQRLRIPS